MKYLMGIDQSIRSTGIVIVDENLKLIESQLIVTLKDTKEDNQRLEMIYEIKNQFFDILKKYNDIDIYIEGISFSSNSKVKDFLIGLQYYLRMSLYESNYYSKIISVQHWRNKILKNRYDKEYLKELRKSKPDYKELCYSLLPEDVKKNFMETEKNIDKEYKDFKLKSKKYQDLTDAYFICESQIT